MAFCALSIDQTRSVDGNDTSTISHGYQMEEGHRDELNSGLFIAS